MMLVNSKTIYILITLYIIMQDKRMTARLCNQNEKKNPVKSLSEPYLFMVRPTLVKCSNKKKKKKCLLIFDL